MKPPLLTAHAPAEVSPTGSIWPPLTPELIEAFAGAYLSPRYDTPQPTPDLHRECWTRYCSPVIAAATAAPRNHAKSTALTHDFILASVLFRDQSYVILVGSSEELAIEHLQDIASELRDNEELVSDFKIKQFITSAKTDIIVECNDGYQFRIIARGAEQKIRGRKWNGKRPGLIVCDDLEDDEQVENKDRRSKFRRWFFRACKQALRDGGKIRVHGTILHEDSLLNRLIKNKGWASKLYKAHKGFDDFREILWPEKFPEERLRAIRDEFIAEFDAAGYSQEYLNDPFDNDEAYLRRDDMLAMKEADYDSPQRFGAAIDFALSKQDSGNQTAMTVGGLDISNTMLLRDVRCGRWDALEIIDQMFLLQAAWDPEWIDVEGGQIWLAIEPMIEAEMRIRNVHMNIRVRKPIKDKKARGRALQKRTRSHAIRFDKKASWWPATEHELLRFTGNSEAVADDIFDSMAWLAQGFAVEVKQEEEDFLTEEEEDFNRQSRMHKIIDMGRSQVTGY